MKKIMFIAIGVMLFACANLVLAGPGDRKGRDRDQYMLDSLNLTVEQMEKIRVLRESYMRAKNPLQNQMFSKRAELKLLWMQTKADSEKIKSMQKEIHDLKWQLKIKRTDYQLAFRDILNPEQLSKYILLKQDRKRVKKKKGRQGRY